ncbi:MAG TPA: LPS export ABC transporter periplasmic protein LptC [Candidatus Baltobacteraceae bacterium]|nr:LPS export ABC transporter periplasmic protein LptC [Candidatus Baltobacteraceae bacterium]
MSRRLVALVAVWVLAGCNPKAPAVEPGASLNPAATPTGISLKITGNGNAKAPARFVEQKDNRKYYQLLASTFESVGAAGSAVVTFTDAHASFFGKDGSQLDARAPRAVVDQKRNEVTLEGGVHATNSEGMTLACDILTYDRGTEMIHGVGHVVITNKNGFHGTGNRFDSDISLTHTTMR